MIKSWEIRLEMGDLLFLSVLFPNPLPVLSFVVAEIQYGSSKKKQEKKGFFIKNRYFNIEKVPESSQDTIERWIK